MDVSAFTVAVPHSDGSIWTINTLHGTEQRLTAADRSLLEDAPLSDLRRYALVQSLLSNRIAEAQPETDRALYRALLDAGAGKHATRALRLGYLLDYTSKADLQATLAFLRRDLEPSIEVAPRHFFYAWYFTEKGRDRLCSLANSIACLPPPTEGPDGRHLVLYTDGQTPLTDEALEAIGKLGFGRGSSEIVFVLHERAASSMGSSALYAERIFEQQARFYALGLLPSYIFRCTRASFHFMIGEMFEALCFSGVYPRSLSFTLSNSDDMAALTCELYGCDWSLYADHGFELAVSDKHQLSEPLGLGVPDKLRALLQNGTEGPILRHCPFSHQSFIFGATGAIAPCPVALSKAAAGEHPHSAVDFGNIYEKPRAEAVANWAHRGPESIGACGNCAVAPVCGSGCPLAALESGDGLFGAPCPPLGQIIFQEAAVARRCKHLED